MKTITKKESLSVLVLLASVVICYANTVKNPFIYDDESLIVTNAMIVNLNAETVKAAFTDKQIYNMAIGEIYRPLYLLLLSAEYNFFALNPVGYHIVNILLHYLSALLLFALLKSLHESEWFALLAALIFSMHPVNTESVAWIKGCDMILCNVSYIASLIYYIKQSRSNESLLNYRYAMSLLLFILALLSKEMAATLPLVIISYELLINKNRKSVLKITPYILILIGFICLRTTVLGQLGQDVGYFGRGAAENTYTSLSIFFSYLRLILFPFNQNVDYISYPVSKNILSSLVLLSIATVVVLLTLIYTFRQRAPLASFFIAWFLITLLPVSNIIPVKILFAERFMYLPAIGIIALFSYLLSQLKINVDRRAIINFILSAMIVSLSLLTIFRNEVWSSPKTLWTDALKKDPYNGRAHGNMVFIELDKGDVKSARAHLLISMDSIIVSSASFISMSQRFKEAGDMEAAILALKRASLDSRLHSAHRNLGMIYQSQGNTDESIQEYKREIALNPNDLVSLVNLAVLTATNNNCDEAENFFNRAFVLKPGDLKLKGIYKEVMTIKCNK